MLSLAGASAYVWSWKIGIAVALVMLAVVTSSGRPCTPTRVAAATTRSQRSISAATRGSRSQAPCCATTCSRSPSRSHPVRSTPPPRCPSSWPRGVPRRRSWWFLLAALNLRGIRESGTFFAIPLWLHGGDPRHVRPWHVAVVRGRPAPGGECGPRDPQGAGLRGTLTTIGLVFLLARAFSSGCAALTAWRRLERCSRLPEAEVEERGHHAAAARSDRDHDDAERDHLGPRDGPALRRPTRPGPADEGRRAPVRRLRPARRHRPDRPRRVSRLFPRVSTSWCR